MATHDSPDSTLNPPAPATADPEAAEEKNTQDSPFSGSPLEMLTANPTAQDMWCLAAISLSGIVTLALIPLKAWLLGAPERLPWLVGIIGSATGVTALGSLRGAGQDIATVLPLAFGALLLNKYTWIYWWAGKLWGKKTLTLWTGQSARAARSYTYAERWVKRLGPVGFLLAFSPIPLPIGMVVWVTSGIHGMKLKWVFLINYLGALMWELIYFTLGYQIGDTATVVLKQYAKWANWIVIALLVVIVIQTIRKSRSTSTP